MRVRPDVSVVVIAYNDAERLPHAVASALAQSLGAVETVIVDDGSTDGTAEAADRLAAAHPGRVRAVHLPSNSGGCGRPRNRGVEASAGRYLMFLDSDDLLDRHACLNLLAAAEDTGADIVSGLCDRIFLDLPAGAKGRVRPWYPWLYQRSAVYESLGDNPNLLYDTLSTNKAYRRGFLEEHGLRFVERLHYEDLLFTAEAYLAAGRTALIPHRVYQWLVRERVPAPSISNRRAELANFADRLEIHRRIDMLFALRGAYDLRRAKDVKFVNHDLVLYLRELRDRDPRHRAGFLDLAAAYLDEMDPRVFEEANPLPAIAAYLVREGDHAGALAAAEYDPGKRPELRARLVERDGRVFWGAAGRRTARSAAASWTSPGSGSTCVPSRTSARRTSSRGWRCAAGAPSWPGTCSTRWAGSRRTPSWRLAGVPRPAPPGAAGTGPRVDPARGRPARLAGRVRPGPADPADRDHRPGVGRAAAPAGGRRGGGHPPRRGPRIAVPRRGRAARQAAVDEVRRRPAPPLRHRGGHLAFALETGGPWARLAGAAARRAARSPAGRLSWGRGGGWGAACGGR
ncbi:glycosyltransferase [Actinomadura madurae]|uniref:glycosyltransferase n=1 Tax=Actinomadura madurae TaxID=1993 RepID=UPI0020D209AC|nr:glycosyltransferase [Actinomadura madurae]MCQ0021242.1 glycosyltransferase [Actinomadura madurae]